MRREKSVQLVRDINLLNGKVRIKLLDEQFLINNGWNYLGKINIKNNPSYLQFQKQQFYIKYYPVIDKTEIYKYGNNTPYKELLSSSNELAKHNLWLSPFSNDFLVFSSMHTSVEDLNKITN